MTHRLDSLHVLLLAALALVLGGRTTLHAACTPLACGETLSGRLSTPGEVDCYQFTVEAGEAVSITTQVTAGVFQACWRLEGTPDVFCGQGERFLADPGTYTIDVFDANQDQSGSYDINMVVVSDTPSNCAATETCGQVATGNIAALGESRTLKFLAAAHDSVSITAQETGGGLSACWELYDPTGLSLGGTCGQREKALAVPGYYTIRVFDGSDSNTGSYDVSLAFISATPSGCAEPIACGQTLSRAIAAIGESDTFHFTGAPGDTVSITSSETGGGMTPCWNLYDPQGTFVTNGCGEGTKTLAAAGQYTIRVHDRA